MVFTWDASKAAANLNKHGVNFEEAISVFLDPLSLSGADPEHSIGEERWILFGRSTEGRFLLVSYAEALGEIIRIISARPGTMPERMLHEEG